MGGTPRWSRRGSGQAVVSALALATGAGSHVRHPVRTAGDVLRAVIRTVGELSITFGVLLLLFVVWQLWWTDVAANREHEQLTDQLVREWAGAPPPPVVTPEVPALESPSPEAVPVAEPAMEGQAFAVLRIPRLGEDYARPIIGGTSASVLQQGLGHYSGTVPPGGVGNFAIAGHRTTYGAPLNRIDELEVGDPLVVQTSEGYYTYRVTEARIVSPEQVEVVAPVPGDPTAVPTRRMITLTSCHPKYSARQRYIVHGEFESFQPTTAAAPVVVAGG